MFSDLYDGVGHPVVAKLNGKTIVKKTRGVSKKRNPELDLKVRLMALAGHPARVIAERLAGEGWKGPQGGAITPAFVNHSLKIQGYENKRRLVEEREEMILALLNAGYFEYVRGK